MTPSIKCVYSNQIHKLNLESAVFDHLVQNIRAAFKKLPTLFQLSYLDEDKDEVMLCSQQDLNVMLASALKTYRITIRQMAAKPQFQDNTVKVPMQEDSKPVEEDDEQKVSELKQSQQIQPLIQKIAIVSDSDSQQSKAVSIGIEQPMMEIESNNNTVQPKSDMEVQKTTEPIIIEEVKSMEKQQVVTKPEQPVPVFDPTQIQNWVNSRIQERIPFVIERLKNKIMGQVMYKFGPHAQPSAQNRTQNKSNLPLNVHQRVKCDDCGVQPIVGFRYKCSVCPNFDLCQKCESKQTHPHALLKIRTRDQAPRSIMTVLQQDRSNDVLEVNGNPIDLQNIWGIGKRIFKDNCHAWRKHHKGWDWVKNGDDSKCPWRRRKCNQNNEQDQDRPTESKNENKEVTTQTQSKPQKDTKVIENTQNKPSAQTQASFLHQRAKYISEVFEMQFNRALRIVTTNQQLDDAQIIQKICDYPDMQIIQ